MMFHIRLHLSYQSATSLSSDQLPACPIEVSSAKVDFEKVDALQKIISQFNAGGDTLLTDVFSNVYGACEFDFQVIYTSGISAPYDAWMVPKDGKPVVYFNLSEWTVDELYKQGLAVVIHEVTHALLEPFSKRFDANDRLNKLEKIIFDEGVAHFFGFPGERSALLIKHYERWIQSEVNLEKALKLLRSNSLTDAEEEELLLKSNTGPFWEKYGAISGMFRVAKIYTTTGPQGVIKAIEELSLLKV